MNFTREPMIETVLTPKEGYKLSIRSSSGANQEEYLVEAVEIVSFGRAHFFRSLEKQKPFLLPTSSYEVVEVKEARMVLKGVGFEKSIKIGGGKEIREGEEKTEERSEQQQYSYQDKKRNKRNRRKGHYQGRPEESMTSQQPSQETPLETAPQESVEEKKEPEAPPVVRKLIPPPSTLIKEKLARIKETIDEELASNAPVEETKPLEEKKEPEEEFPPFNQDSLD